MESKDKNKDKVRRLFGTDGVRDVSNSGNMTPEMAMKLGRAFIRFYGCKRVVVGRDTRRSGKMLEGALCAGMASEGADIYLIGIIPTPGVSWAVKALNADSGAVISASHNPAEYNGIKFLGSDGCKLSDDEELAIERLLELDEKNNSVNVGDIYDIPELVDDYAKHLTSVLNDGVFAALNKDIAFDCANGAASVVLPSLTKYAAISGEHVIASDFDGLNINHDSGVMHMENLTGYVTRNRLRLGFAFDGDADRVLACDSKGRIINGDIILWVLARWLAFKKFPGSDSTVVTVMSNMALESHLANEGIKTIRCPVGDRYVLDAMRKSGSGLGGEQSGHIIASTFTGTGDGICTAMLFLNAVHDLGENMDTLVDRFGCYPQKLTNLRLKKSRELVDIRQINEIVEAYQKKFFNGALHGRIFIRTSGTEPLLRILVEAKEAEAVNKISDELALRLEEFC